VAADRWEVLKGAVLGIASGFSDRDMALRRVPYRSEKGLYQAFRVSRLTDVKVSCVKIRLRLGSLASHGNVGKYPGPSKIKRV
jgi:hypothetical protein